MVPFIKSVFIDSQVVWSLPSCIFDEMCSGRDSDSVVVAPFEHFGDADNFFEVLAAHFRANVMVEHTASSFFCVHTACPENLKLAGGGLSMYSKSLCTVEVLIVVSHSVTSAVLTHSVKVVSIDVAGLCAPAVLEKLLRWVMYVGWQLIPFHLLGYAQLKGQRRSLPQRHAHPTTHWHWCASMQMALDVMYSKMCSEPCVIGGRRKVLWSMCFMLISNWHCSSSTLRDPNVVTLPLPTWIRT